MTVLVLGGAALGGLYSPVSDADARATLEAAWALGVRGFDTAPHYGAGLSERRVGDFLRTRLRDAFEVSTKVGRLLGADGTEHRDYSAAGVLRSLEASLDRTGLDRFDTVYIHDPEDHMDQALFEAAPALSELRAQGVIGRFGAGMNFSAELTRFANETDADVVMCAGRYTVLDRSAGADLLPACERRRVGVVAAGVYNSGILASPVAGACFDYSPASDALLRTVQTLERECAEFGVPLKAAAEQFPLRSPVVTSICVGARTPAEVEENVRLLSVPIPDELWTRLDAVVGQLGGAGRARTDDDRIMSPEL